MQKGGVEVAANIFVHGLDEALAQGVGLVPQDVLFHAFVSLIVPEPASDGVLDLFVLAPEAMLVELLAELGGKVLLPTVVDLLTCPRPTGCMDPLRDQGDRATRSPICCMDLPWRSHRASACRPCLRARTCACRFWRPSCACASPNLPADAARPDQESRRCRRQSPLRPLLKRHDRI